MWWAYTWGGAYIRGAYSRRFTVLGFRRSIFAKGNINQALNFIEKGTCQLTATIFGKRYTVLSFRFAVSSSH